LYQGKIDDVSASVNRQIKQLEVSFICYINVLKFLGFFDNRL